MIAEHKGEVPLVVYILPFLAGIGCASFFSISNSLFPVGIFGFLCLAFIILNLVYIRFKLYRVTWVGGLLIHSILFFAGIVTVQQHDDRNYPDYFASQKADRLLVNINNEPVLKGKYWHCSANVIQAGNTPTCGKILLTIMADSLNEFKYGYQLAIPANFKPIDPPFNPAVFNYKAYLANQHIYQQSFLYPGQYKIIGKDAGNAVVAYSLNLRRRLVQKFKANMADSNAVAVASTLILGYKADLSTDILQAYAKTGTIHVLSVSGAHVAIVFVFISFLLSFLNGSRYGQYLKAIISIILIWAYALLTGFSPAVCRAALMISMVILGKAGYRYTNTANLLALSAFVLLLYDPLLIADVGFQLSYLAVLGLIMLQPVINRWLNFKDKYLQKLWYYISASLAAQVITFPLSAFYFHQFPLYFLVSNLFIIIPSEVILFTGIISLWVPQLPILSKPVFWILEHSIQIMNKGLLLIERQPYSAISKIWLTNYDCLLIFITVVSFFYFLHNRRLWLLKLSLVCLLIVSALVSSRQIKSLHTQSITFYSLNKHSGVLFKNGRQGVLLSDLLPADATYKFSVQPGIDSNRVENLQTAYLSSNIETAYLKKNASLIGFLGQRVLIFDERMQFIRLARKLPVDYLYITGNPHSSINFINKNYSYKKLVIDGSNSSQTIKKLVNEADSLNINYAVLKRNKCLVITSN